MTIFLRNISYSMPSPPPCGVLKWQLHAPALSPSEHGCVVLANQVAFETHQVHRKQYINVIASMIKIERHFKGFYPVETGLY